MQNNAHAQLIRLSNQNKTTSPDTTTTTAGSASAYKNEGAPVSWPGISQTQAKALQMMQSFNS